MFFFPFQFVYMVDYTDRFLYVEPSLHLWDEANLIMMDDFSDVFLDAVLIAFSWFSLKDLLMSSNKHDKSHRW